MLMQLSKLCAHTHLTVTVDMYTRTMPRGRNTSNTVLPAAVDAPVSTQLPQLVLVLFHQSLDAIFQRLATIYLNEVHGQCSLVYMNQFNECPDGRVRVSHETNEGVVPALADIVGAFLICEGGLIDIPDAWCKQWRNPAEMGDDTATETWPSNSLRDAPNIT